MTPPADRAALESEIRSIEAELDRADDNAQVTRLRTLLAIRRVELEKLDMRTVRRARKWRRAR